MAALINIKLKGFKKLKRGLTKEGRNYKKNINKAIRKSALIISEDIKSFTPVKSGTLKKGIYPEYSNLKAMIKPHNAPYAIYIHKGTNPYIIKPKIKKALYWKGAKYPVKKVKHPGIKANPFMDKGFNKAKPKVITTFKRMNDNIIKRITI